MKLADLPIILGVKAHSMSADQHCYDILSSRDKKGIPIIIVIHACIAAALFLARWSWAGTAVGLFAIFAMCLWIDALQETLWVSEEGLSLTSLFRQKQKLEWNEIKRIHVLRDSRRQRIILVRIISEQSRAVFRIIVPNTAILIPGSIEKLDEIIDLLHQKLPNISWTSSNFEGINSYSK